nr:NAD(P)-dependent oxidoreductase [Pseudorhodobacter aquimaris]
MNCARGGIIDEQALADALATQHIAGAASDVFAIEPPRADNPLFADGLRFIGTPHLAASTHAGLRRTGMIIGQTVLTALNDIKGSDT